MSTHKSRGSRKSRKSGNAKGRVVGHIRRLPGMMMYVDKAGPGGMAAIRAMAPHRSRSGNKKKTSRKSRNKGSRRSKKSSRR